MKKILIVEDESLVALDIASALKKEGYAVTDIVESGADALESIEQDCPDLIMMDINIDGPIDGVETSERIKALYDIPLVFLTAYNDKKTIDRAVQTNPKGYLIKPFKRQELYATVTLALQGSDNNRANNSGIPILDSCVYYPERSELHRIGEAVSLTKKEKLLLDLLLTHQRTVVSFVTIEYELWPEKSVSSTTRRTLIHRLREKVGGDAIKTVKDLGCVLEM